jgi:hypothetical protein
VTTATLEQIYADIVNSVGYRMTVGPTDKLKVSRRRAGERTELPSARLARAAWRVAALLSPLVPPPPPPPPPLPTKFVAPITVRQEGGSDQRVCLFVNGNLRPGVFRRADGTYGDDSGAVYAANGDGLEDSSVRTKVNDPALVGARSMDGRSACECPTVGDPLKNTGSWTV